MELFVKISTKEKEILVSSLRMRLDWLHSEVDNRRKQNRDRNAIDEVIEKELSETSKLYEEFK